MLQIITIIAMLIIAAVIFKKYPIKINSQTIALVAFLIVIYQVVSYFSISLTLFGYPSLKIGFGQLVLIVSGSILAPGWALITGFLADILGVVLHPTGGYYFGFAFNSMLTCLIPSLIFMNRRKLNLGLLKKILYTLLVALPILATLYAFSLTTVTSNDEVIEITKLMKFGVMISSVIISGAIFAVLKIMTKNSDEEKVKVFILMTLSIIGIHLLIQFFLTPLWLLDMYNTPFFASQFVRILKAIIIMPLYIALGYSIYNVITKILKRDII